MSFAKAAERPEGNMRAVDPGRLERLEEEGGSGGKWWEVLA